VSEPIGRSLVPPRPNLGPESWPTPPWFELYWLILAIPALAVLGWVCWKIIRRGLARSHSARASHDDSDATPRGRLVALSKSTRNALTARFGATWRAKTTEELAAEPLLAEVLGPEPLRDLIQFLDRVDRLKFAAERSNQFRQPLDDELAAWSPRIAALISKIETKSNGRHKQSS
jgi:hypothetical protein